MSWVRRSFCLGWHGAVVRYVEMKTCSRGHQVRYAGMNLAWD